MTEAPRHPLEDYRAEAQVDPEGNLRAPTAAELEHARFAPGSAAKHPYGLLYQGEYETPADGTAVAVRLNARALALAGLPVRLTSFSHVVVNDHGYPDPVHEVGLPPEVEHEVGALRNASIGVHVPVIKHAVVRDAEHAHALLVPRSAVPESDDVHEIVRLRRLVAERTILYSVWERDRLDELMVRELGRAGQLWVPCVQNATMLEQSGLDAARIQVVPHPYDPDDDICKVAELKRATESPRGWRLFYSIGRWEPRKGYADLIAAFLEAFTPADRVMLTIKYTGGQWKDYPTPEEAVRRALARSPYWSAEKVQERVVLLGGRGPRTGILELHYRNNIYVSSSHGEAWCLPAFEALLSGNALVTVPYGGICDFMPADGDPKLSVVAPTGLAPVPASYHWPAETRWCGYTIEALATALRRAAAPEIAELPEALKRFEIGQVSKQLRQLVIEHVGRVSPAAMMYYQFLKNEANPAQRR